MEIVTRKGGKRERERNWTLAFLQAATAAATNRGLIGRPIPSDLFCR